MWSVENPHEYHESTRHPGKNRGVAGVVGMVGYVQERNCGANFFLINNY